MPRPYSGIRVPTLALNFAGARPTVFPCKAIHSGSHEKRGVTMSAKRSALLAGALLLGLGNSIATNQALAAGFLCADGITGDSTADGFDRCSNIESVQLGLARPVATVGPGAAREAGALTCSEVSVTKSADSASVQYWNRMRRARSIPEVSIVHTNLEGEEIARYTLTEAIVAGLAVSSAFSEPASESLIFNAEAIEYTGPDGRPALLDCTGIER